MPTEFLLLVATLAIVFYIWQRRSLSYWKRLGVKYIKPVPIFGNMRPMLTGRAAGFEQIRLLHAAKGFENEPLIGFYMLHRPGLVIKDLELIKAVMIKNNKQFVNRTQRADPHNDPLGYNNLFFIRNADWKELRHKLSPVFTSGKIKQMYPLMVEIGKNMENHLDDIPNGSIIPIKEVCARLTTDLIATTAFGVNANSLKDKGSEFYKFNKSILELTLKRGFDFAVIFMLPMLVSLARVKVFSEKTSEFMRQSLSYVLAEREKSGVRRNDLIDILLAMKREAESKPENVQDKAKLLDFLVAQAAVFQTAGYETSSATMTMALYEFALNPEVQERLRKEVMDYFGDNDHIDYERIQDMPYLNQVVNETLRKYPSIGMLERECTTPFSLKPYYDVELPVGTPVFISTLAIHRDAKYWPEPEKFLPERFAPENRDKLNMDTYMPFGMGPRNCIGMRLGLLQVKLGLVHFLRHHRVVKCEQTVDSIVFSSFTPVLAPKEELMLKVEKV